MLTSGDAKETRADRTAPVAEGAPQRLRVCAYARVSTDRDDQQNSYASQVRYFGEYISRRPDWVFAGIYADEGTSGTSTKKRGEFCRMISDALAGRIDLIVTKEVSRFARNTVDTLSYTRQLKKLGVHVFFVSDNINTGDNDGELRLSIMATFAQDESRKTSERVKWGQRRRMEQGVVFGRDLLGYSVKNGRLLLNESEAETVRLIFHKYLSEGKGCRVIARELAQAGISPKRAREWTNASILRILRNEKYVGDLCQKKTVTPDYLDHGKKRNPEPADMIYIKDHHPDLAIIDRELWDRTQAELLRRRPSPEQGQRHSCRYWCSGRLLCGKCGQSYVSRTKALKNGGVYLCWRCRSAAKHGREKAATPGEALGCTSQSVGDRALRYIVSYAIRSLCSDEKRIAQSLLADIRRALDVSSEPDDSRRLLARIETLRLKKSRIIDLAAAGAISAEDLRRQNEGYDRDIAAVTERLSRSGGSSSASLEACKKQLETLDLHDAFHEQVLGQTLKRAVIHGDHTLDVYLLGVPFGLRIKYTGFGRGESFRVEINSMQAVPDELNEKQA